MKNRHSLLKLFFLLLLGALMGMVINIITSFSRNGMEELGAVLARFFRQKGLVVESVLVVLVIIAGGGIYIRLSHLWRKEQYADDEQADRWGEKFDHWAVIGQTLVNVSVGLFFMMGVISLPNDLLHVAKMDGIEYLLLTAVMVLGCVMMSVLEIMYYNLLQKRDPKKKGDPSSFNFNRKWLESCDETEKLVIYQAGYKAFNCIQILLMVGIVAAIVGKTRFGTGDFSIILLGILWITGNLCFGIWKMKGLKKI